MIVDKLLYNFRDELTELQEGNEDFIIGGSCALLLHGLDLTWECSDLDIIIFGGVRDYGSIKREKNGMVINYVYAKKDVCKAPNLLEYKGYEVNSVREVVKYKHTNGQLHCRLKDIQQMQALKNNNFNLG